MNKEILEYSICKRLYDAGVRVETYTNFNEEWDEWHEVFDKNKIQIPALSIVDWLELMKDEIEVLFYNANMERWEINFEKIRWTIAWKTLKECVEKSLVYMLDN